MRHAASDGTDPIEFFSPYHYPGEPAKDCGPAWARPSRRAHDLTAQWEAGNAAFVSRSARAGDQEPDDRAHPQAVQGRGPRQNRGAHTRRRAARLRARHAGRACSTRRGPSPRRWSTRKAARRASRTSWTRRARRCRRGAASSSPTGRRAASDRRRCAAARRRAVLPRRDADPDLPVRPGCGARRRHRRSRCIGDPIDAEKQIVIPVERPAPNEVLCYMLASEVNFNDIWAITGRAGVDVRRARSRLACHRLGRHRADRLDGRGGPARGPAQGRRSGGGVLGPERPALADGRARPDGGGLRDPGLQHAGRFAPAVHAGAGARSVCPSRRT